MAGGTGLGSELSASSGISRGEDLHDLRVPADLADRQRRRTAERLCDRRRAGFQTRRAAHRVAHCQARILALSRGNDDQAQQAGE